MPPNDSSAFLNSQNFAWEKNAPPPVMAGFYFRRRRERLNWRLLASMNVDQIMKEVDIKALQDIMENLTFCDLEGEDLRYPDQNIVKLLQLAQLTIEYLLHSQQYLLDHRRALTTQAENLGSTLAQLRGEHAKQNAEVAALKKETRILRKSMYAYQLMTKLPGGIGQQPAAPTHPSTYYRCPHCTKVFVSQAYVESHVHRRHADLSPARSPQKPPAKAEGRPEAPPGMTMEKLMEEMERVTGKITDVENQLRAEMESKVEKEVAARQAVLDAALKQEKLKYEEELQALRNSLRQEQETERQAFLKERDELKALNEKLRNEKQPASKFGVLEDDSSSFSDFEDHNDKYQQDIADLKNAMAVSKKETQAEMEARLANVQKALQDERDRKAAQEEAHRRAQMEEQMAHNREIQEWRAHAEVQRNKDHAVIDDLRGSLDRLKGQLSTAVSVDGQSPVHPPATPGHFQTIDSDSQEHVAVVPVAVGSKLTWEAALQLMTSHNSMPLPTSSWIKTLYPYDAAVFASQRSAIATEVEARLVQWGIQPQQILREWGTGRGVEQECERIQVEMDVAVAEKGRADPLYERMRAFLGETVGQVTGGYRLKRFSKPPPIVTTRDSEVAISDNNATQRQPRHHHGPGRRRGLRSQPRSGSLHQPRTPRSRGLRSAEPKKSRFFQRRASSLPSTSTPTLGGWKFPSLRRNAPPPKSATSGADANWSNDSSEFTGSEEEPYSAMPKSASSRVKRGGTRHHQRPQVERRRSRDADAYDRNDRGLARRASTASRQPRPRARSPARTLPGPPSPSKLKEGLTRLTRALSVSAAGVQDMLFKRAVPPPFPRQDPYRRESIPHREDPARSPKGKKGRPASRWHKREIPEDIEDYETDDTMDSSVQSDYSTRTPRSAKAHKPAPRPAKKQAAAGKVSKANMGKSPTKGPNSAGPRSSGFKDTSDPLAPAHAKLSKLSTKQKAVDLAVSDISPSDDSAISETESMTPPQTRVYSNNRTVDAIQEESEDSQSQSIASDSLGKPTGRPAQVTTLRSSHLPPRKYEPPAKSIPPPSTPLGRPSIFGNQQQHQQPQTHERTRVAKVSQKSASRKTDSEFDISSLDMSNSSPAMSQSSPPKGSRRPQASEPDPDDLSNFSDIIATDDEGPSKRTPAASRPSGKPTGVQSPSDMSQMLDDLDSFSDVSEVQKPPPAKSASGPIGNTAMRGFPSQSAKHTVEVSDDNSWDS
ncbi:hypothetical protein DFJ77DRAFT_512157 [Powellomyces hirtus]|nr:hypothetical protein DFJ77DRAFT_512157 [Powellomyces hirtus]